MLAEPFSRHLCEHIAHSPKQVTSRGSRFLDTCRAYNDGGTSNFFIAQNGDIFPCMYAFLNADDCIGNISKGLDNKKLSSLRDVYALDNPDCRLCIMNSYCVGTRCKYLNKYQTGEYLMPSVQVCRILGASNITVYRHGLA